MSEPTRDPEKVLNALGQAVRAGLARQYPVTPKERAAVRDLIRQQWEQEQARQESPAADAATVEIERRQAEQAKRKHEPASEQERATREREEREQARRSRNRRHGHSH